MAVDEQIPFKGTLNCKQYIKSKPTKWGIKIFAICGASGLLYDFIPYQGKTTEYEPHYKPFGLGAGTVMQLSERINQPNVSLFFDNYFSTNHLFQYLQKKEIKAVGTVQVNRFSKPPFSPDAVFKKEPRGSTEEVISSDGAVILTKWLDNNTVTIGSNHIDTGTPDQCKRFDKKESTNIMVSRPEVIALYNSNMGGVDKFDFLMALYRTFIRSRKWTLRMMNHAIDMAVVNSWIEYRRDADKIGIPKNKQLDLIHFRQEIAEALILAHQLPVRKRGRPSRDSPSPELHPKRARVLVPVQDMRYDNLGHIPEFQDIKNNQRCKNGICQKKSFVRCIKCNVPLCITRENNRFKEFHTR